MLQRTAALVAAMGLPLGLHRRALAGSGNGLRFVFVFAPGGWDPTRVLAAERDNASVAMDSSEQSTYGDLRHVSHPARPSVDAFFAAHHERSVILNGVLVPAIAHELCTVIALTGSASGERPDWAAQLADAEREQYTVPHLVLDGPSFAGELGASVARVGTNGQLEALLSGDAVHYGQTQVGELLPPSESMIDRYLLRRSKARRDGSRSSLERQLHEANVRALQKAIDLKKRRYVMDFSGGTSFADQASVATQALGEGLSRCVSLTYTGGGLGWDTHSNNDADQSVLWEGLFSGLGELMQLLSITPGNHQPTLAAETVVVVMSEMGRTPQLNAFAGKDHWPYTSVLMVGPGLVGGQVMGGFDALYYGKLIDPSSGQIDEGGQPLSMETLGATLLTLADIDPGEVLPGVAALTGLLA